MKHLVTSPRKFRPRGVALLVPVLAVAMLGACMDDEVHTLGAQQARAPSSQASADSAVAPPAPLFPPEDTATRTVGDALSQTVRDTAAADSLARADSITKEYNAGEDPEFAREMGWPVDAPRPLPGAILPAHRIIAYYGNPLSTRMGVLGEYPKDEMLRMLDAEVAKWNAADPSHPVRPALHLIASVAQGSPGVTGMYRMIMYDTLVEKVHDWARSRNALLFIDIQTGLSSIQEMLPKFEHFLMLPDVHLAVDPEFMMVESGAKPGTKIGSMSVADINYVTAELARIVREHHLPPKVLVIHRFTRGMVTGDTEDIILHPEVQIVMNMDGWGAPWLKRDSYRDYIVRYPVEYTGFKIFYHNDQKKPGSRLMTVDEVLKLRPTPLYIQYQ